MLKNDDGLGLYNYKQILLLINEKLKNLSYNEIIEQKYINENIYSKDAYEFLSFILKPNMVDRPNCLEILNHKFLKNEKLRYKIKYPFL